MGKNVGAPLQATGHMGDATMSSCRQHQPGRSYRTTAPYSSSIAPYGESRFEISTSSLPPFQVGSGGSSADGESEVACSESSRLDPASTNRDIVVALRAASSRSRCMSESSMFSVVFISKPISRFKLAPDQGSPVPDRGLRQPTESDPAGRRPPLLRIVIGYERHTFTPTEVCPGRALMLSDAPKMSDADTRLGNQGSRSPHRRGSFSLEHGV